MLIVEGGFSEFFEDGEHTPTGGYEGTGGLQLEMGDWGFGNGGICGARATGEVYDAYLDGNYRGVFVNAYVTALTMGVADYDIEPCQQMAEPYRSMPMKSMNCVPVTAVRPRASKRRSLPLD